MPGKVFVDPRPGDRLRLETPGGGGDGASVGSMYGDPGGHGTSVRDALHVVAAASSPARRSLVAASLGWMLDSFDVMLYALML